MFNIKNKYDSVFSTESKCIRTTHTKLYYRKNKNSASGSVKAFLYQPGILEKFIESSLCLTIITLLFEIVAIKNITRHFSAF